MGNLAAVPRRRAWVLLGPRWPLRSLTADARVRAFKTSSQGDWFNHVNVNAHDHGGHFIPWESPDAWVGDLRRTFRHRTP